MDDDNESDASAASTLVSRLTRSGSFASLDNAYDAEGRRRRDDVIALQEVSDVQFMNLQYTAAAMFFVYGKDERAQRSIYTRMDINAFLLSKMNDPLHTRRIRMEYSSFVKLTNLVRDKLTSVRPDQADRRGGLVSPEMCVYAILRYLAGATYICISDFLGFATATFYRVFHKTLEAIIDCRALDLHWPTTVEKCEVLANEFGDISYGQAIMNCVGAVDGYVMQIKTPPKKLVGNPKAYFSGHYQMMAINIQAVADSHCRFLHFAMCAPGSASDRVAVNRRAGRNRPSLLQMIQSIPEHFVVIADSAYPVTEKCIPMFTHPDTNVAEFSNYNFFASQLRMRVEMAFGIMVNKWGILQAALKNHLGTDKNIVLVISRLHNFVINEKLLVAGAWDPVAAYPNIAADALVERDDDDSDLEDDIEGFNALQGDSFMRIQMRNRIRDKGLTRPIRNLRRNANRNM